MTTEILHNSYGIVQSRHACTPFLDFVLLPLGEVYNYNVQQLTKGDVIEFLDGALRKVHSVIVAQRDSVINALCNAKYNINLEDAFQRWEKNCGGSGWIYSDRCLIVFFENKEILEPW